MPTNYSFEQAAALPLVGLTALQSLQPHIHKPSTSTSVLVVGGSGGTGHVALQVAQALGAVHVTSICSSKNADFCRRCGATHIVDYTQNDLSKQLETAPGRPFDVVLDCVTSADPRDQRNDYPTLIQKNSDILSSDYVYRRLGGSSPDWIRARLERYGVNCWKDKHEKLFWIRFPHSSGELQQLQEWAQAGKLTPHVSNVYDFSADGVRSAFDALLGRRVQGKVVVQVYKEDTNNDPVVKAASKKVK